mmetsp:Transcript_32900/g.79596  ORF Transcript_32900/g.79596 Transcript_32900/m.79596 type:complete len:95 (-) Transcript_32900:117-401(-)
MLHWCWNHFLLAAMILSSVEEKIKISNLSGLASQLPQPCEQRTIATKSSATIGDARESSQESYYDSIRGDKTHQDKRQCLSLVRVQICQFEDWV